MSKRYLSLANQGKNAWWRYGLTILIVVVFWQIIGVIPFGILVAFLDLDGDPSTQFNPEKFQFEGVSHLWPYLALNCILISLFIGLYISLRLLHKRPLISLITSGEQVRWNRFFQGFGVYLLLSATASLIEALSFPGRYQLALNLSEFLIFLPIALLITPIQASAEELFFRGYLMQGIGLKIRNPLVPILVSSILFMLPHLMNPEAQKNMLILASFYFLFGVFLAFITVKDNGLELAMGAHAANNLFIVLIANYYDSALPSPAIFISHLHPVFALMSFIVITIVFYWVLLKSRSRPSI
ncbi:MAG: CPBP family intramembrane metalloprotease [Leptolyngbyaceae cyanobacterium MO_188.B28]|nr:CPBP family intramembrane metalloprotease [Leptolyngbyaceae cyanobacterium MO_188.B28]